MVFLLVLYLLIIMFTEYDGYDDVYGHSVEEGDFCVSPTTGRMVYYPAVAVGHILSNM